MGAGRQSEWLSKLSEAEPDAAHLAAAAQMPEDAHLEPYNKIAWDAFFALKFDRQFTSFGTALPLPFAAVDCYARRYGIEGVAFDHLLLLVRALDTAWLERINDKGSSGGSEGGGDKT